MNEKRAKQLRKVIYGDMSIREQRRYRRLTHGQRVLQGTRALYQKAKQIIKARKIAPKDFTWELAK